MNKAFDNRGEISKSLGKFTEPRRKPECGFSRSALDDLAEQVCAIMRNWHHMGIFLSVTYACRVLKHADPELWQEAIKDPRVANITATDVKNREKELTLKIIAKRTKSGRRYRFGDWLS